MSHGACGLRSDGADRTAVHGVPFVDNVDLEPLAEACATAARWEFMFVVAPLVVRGGTGSPVNPIAIL